VNRSVKILLITILIFPLFYCDLIAQGETECPEIQSKKANRIFDEAVDNFRKMKYSTAYQLLKDVVDMEPEYADAYFVLGLINIKKSNPNIAAAEKYFLQTIEICPSYDPYAYYYLGDIYYGKEEYGKAYKYLSEFLKDVEKIKSDKDYSRAVSMSDFSKYYFDMMENPVPFSPRAVKGISTKDDEYLPIISPDNELALFTRRMLVPPNKNDLVPKAKLKERFVFSQRRDGSFDKGELMPYPFNQFDNEGGATITIDNKELFYTVCNYKDGGNYLNCDIYYSKLDYGYWTDIEALGAGVNMPDTWDSQPTISSDGKTLFFISDRPGGLGGYDIYKSERGEDGKWSDAVNLGPKINSKGNEKSPFIHSDSQTLYFSSDGIMGMGGYDIFFTKLDENGVWSKPKNIGYPINSTDDDVGFFVSTDGKYGYFASNKFNGFGGWDLYSFELYEGARPEKVLFIKGDLKDEKSKEPVKARIELKNAETKKVTKIPVDSATGEYAAVVLFRNDYIMTVKKEGYAYESKYISKKDTLYDKPVEIDVDIKPIEVGETYTLNDIYFPTASYELTEESTMMIDGFIEFLAENPKIRVAIHGHTDNVGNDADNLELSHNRAKSVYDYLLKGGIARDRLSYQGFGESKPIASNKTASGRAKNRRTVFVITDK
jgi:outer membrane protein OmpA-like peptidoglycan-associated protein/tetratricopeptide (TPR) repeat protein